MGDFKRVFYPLMEKYGARMANAPWSHSFGDSSVAHESIYTTYFAGNFTYSIAGSYDTGDRFASFAQFIRFLKSTFNSTQNRNSGLADLSNIGDYSLSVINRAKQRAIVCKEPQEVIYAFERGTHVTSEDMSEQTRLMKSISALTDKWVDIDYRYGMTKEEINELRKANPNAKVIAVLNASDLTDITPEEVRQIASSGAVAVHENVDYIAVILGMLELIQYDREEAPIIARESLLLPLILEPGLYLRDVHTLLPDEGEDGFMGIYEIRDHAVTLRPMDYIGRRLLTHLETKVMA
jgi:hypothetical protein